MLKKIFKQPWFITFAAFLISILLRVIYFSMRWQKSEKNLLVLFANESVILVFWHGRMLMIPFLWKNPNNMNVLISHHRDGELIAKAMKFLGYKTIRGSSSKGGAAALRNILKTLKTESVAITPDGPRGPVFEVGGNLAAIAKISKKPVVLVAYSANPRITLRSWDQMIIPKLFSKGSFQISQPLYYLETDTDEIYTQRIESKLKQMKNEVDAS